MEDNDDLSSQEGGPEIPAGVLRTSKKGWAGEELEMEHSTQQNSTEEYTAVDIKQFQNIQVGAGYQARGVIRQKTGGGDAQKVQDMTAASSESERKRSRQECTKSGTIGSKRKTVDEYLKCDGIREFRKEIEQLLLSASR